MKSIFTKLSTLLLCGAVAMVSCTDFSEDIQNLDNKVDNLGNTTQTELATLQKAITDLEAKLAAQYATKDEVAALKATLENSIASEVAALSEDIAAVSDALKTAKGEINDAIADLDDKKADKTAVDAAVKTATDAIAALKADLEAAKGDLEAEIESVKAEIADAQEQLNSKIDGVDAKAEELHNTILALSDYLKTLEAKVNELKGTLDALSEYLPTIEAKVAELKGTLDALSDHLEGREAEVDAKLNELHATLLALSDHLEEYEATTDFKLVELQGSLAALSVYLEEYEASVDAKFKEILNTFDSLDGFLDEKFAALEATDTDLYKEIEGIRVVLTALNNLLTDETAARMAEDNDLYELIGTSVTALNNLIADLAAEDEAIYAEIDGVRQAFTTLNNLLADEVADRTAEDAAIYELIGTSVTALNNLIADLAAEDDAIYVEMENIRTYIAQVYNSLSYEIQAVDAALKAHIAAFEAFKEAYEAKVDELEATDENLYVEINGLREVITTINNHIEDLKAEDTAIYAEINGLRENLTQLQNAINNRIDEEVAALEDKILESVQDLESMIRDTQEGLSAALRLIAENTELILANAAAIADLEAAVEMLMGWAAGQEENNELQAELITKVYEIVGEMEEQIKALTQKDNELEGLIGKTAGALQTYMDENDARLAELETYIKENIDLLGTSIGNLEAIINDLEARFAARLDALEGQVGKNTEAIDKLVERVQSLVYVPDYDDHKATISWAELYGGESYGVLVKKSVLRYRVYAKADEDAVAAAKAIENAWTPESFYYEVEPVKRAWTRSATVPASLEITDVWAEGEYLNVEVLAKNFNPEFFFSYWYGDNYPRVAMENKPEEGKPVDEKSSYSVSLVLTDGNNNRSTEYTNLVPEYPEFYLAVVLDGEDTDITYREYEDAPVAYLPYDRAEPNEEAVVLEGHRLAFLSESDKYMSADELIAAGYDIQLTRRVNQIQLNTGEKQYHEISPIKPEVREVGNFSITERPFEGITKENDTYAWITKEMTKAEYLALKEKEQNVLTLDYIYNVNGVEVNTEASVEICNRLVEVNLSVDIPWTLETAISTIADSKMYEGPVAATFEYDLAKAANKSLEGYSLYSIIHADDVETSYVPKCPISLSVNDKTVTATLKHGSKARYEFPANNNDDVVDYNTYVVTKKAEFDDLTVTVNVKVNLGEQPKTQEISKDVTFTTASGANGWLFGYWNALEDAYQKFLAEGYIGYVDAPETGKAKFFEAFAYDSSYGNMGDPLMVNQKAGIPQNVNVPFTKNNNENGEHRFQLWHEQLNVNEDGYVDGTEQTIVQKVKPYFGIPFIFTVNGTVDMPDYALDIDPVRVVEGVVDVKGEIAGGVYTVDVSDLAKYYYVVNESGTKSLEAVNEGDVLTVDFELSAMEGAEEDGFNFNNVADQTEYSLNVDWTSSEPYILPMGKAVAMWGTYPHTEVEVNAVLKVNGFPVVSKPITLVTQDPLEIALNDVTVEVTHLSGTNPDPIVAKVYQNFVLTSAVEEGNLFNNAAKTIGGLWYYSHADVTYGVTMDLKFNRVYYKVGEEQIGWDESKIVLEKYTAENLVAPYEVGDLTGNLYIKPDDGDIKTPIYVEFNVNMTHNIHNADKTKCETSGIVTVKFVPEGYVEVAE